MKSRKYWLMHEWIQTPNMAKLVRCDRTPSLILLRVTYQSIQLFKDLASLSVFSKWFSIQERLVAWFLMIPCLL